MLGIQKYKNIDEIQLKPPKTWNHIESLSINERLTIGVIAKYQLVKEKERLVKYIVNYFGLEPKNIDPGRSHLCPGRKEPGNRATSSRAGHERQNFNRDSSSSEHSQKMRQDRSLAQWQTCRRRHL